MDRHDAKGFEYPDPTPMAIPAHLRLPETLQDTMRRLIRVEMSKQAVEAGQESFEEADDFEVDDDDPISPYEMLPMQAEAPAGDLLPKEDQKPPQKPAEETPQAASADGKKAEET